MTERENFSIVSQEAFEDKIGMHRTYYSAVERGEINLTLRTVWRVYAGLRVKDWHVRSVGGDA